MVRLEKALYEQFFNIKQLGRARVFGSPSKWYNEKRGDAYKVAAHKVFNQGISGKFFRLLEPVIAKFTWQWMRDIALQRGLAMEDFLLFQDRELRRDYFFETIARQSLHPYTWLFFKRRRARYYKVERGVRGFFVPEWVRKEGEDRTLAETLENKEAYDDYVYREYMSEITPTARWSILSKWNPLDMFCLYGLWRPEAWDRYFYNEVFYEGYSKEEVRDAEMNPFPGVNLNTEDGRRNFEEEVKRFVGLYPGAVLKPGEEFNFQKFYATWDLVNGKDLTKYEPQYIDGLKKELQERKKLQKEEKGSSNGKKIGKSVPDFMRPKPGFI